MQASSNTHLVRKNGIRSAVLGVTGSVVMAVTLLLQPTVAGIGAHSTPAAASYSHRVEVLPSTGAPVYSRYFAPTRQSVNGTFLSTFNRYGLDKIGYPVSPEQVENGHTVQYFERVRMELHPELQGAGYGVQMTRLGVELTRGAEFNRVASFAPTADRAYMDQTGHSLSGAFLSYWKTNGGIDLFGYPISEPMMQNGFQVQWFERARFEYHPELARSGQAVQLSLLGSIAYQSASGQTTAADKTTAAQATSPAQNVSAPAPVATAPAPAADPAVKLSDTESYVFQAINSQRAAAGLSPVKLSTDITQLSRSRSTDMAARNYFSHTTPEGSQFLQMLDTRNIGYSYAGEILARNNYPDDQAAKTAIDSYLNSAPHKAIIMDGRFTQAGVGYAKTADGMNYFTVIFVQP